jgi:uncharacterized protein (TIGR01777 family)
MNVLIAGGSGLIGSHLVQHLEKKGLQVKILTRTPKAQNHVFWDPYKGEINIDEIRKTEIIINLCGSGLADKRWSSKRKKELRDSRIIPVEFLFELRQQLTELRQYISASGITCYGFEDRPDCYRESDPYGKTYVDGLVNEWENSSRLFSKEVSTVILRFGVVLSGKGGAIPRLLKPIKIGIGAVIGTGQQIIIVGFISHVIDNNLDGVYNLNADNATNENLTIELAKQVNKRIWLPKIPAFVIRLMFGEMSTLLLNGVCVDNTKVLDTGYRFRINELSESLNQLNLQ